MSESIFFMVTDAPEVLQNGKKPLYLRIYEAIAHGIRTGKIAEGQKLPALRELSKRLGISRNTVQNAYNQLFSEGYIEIRERSGCYACRLEGNAVLPEFSAARTAAANDETADLRPQEPDNGDPIIDLSSNRVDPALFPLSVLRRLYRETIGNAHAGDLLQLGEAAGDRVLREAVSRYLNASRGVRCSAEQVVIGAGSEYLLQLAVRLIRADTETAKKSFSFAVENPGYEKTGLVLSDCGCVVIPVPLDGAGISVAALERVRAEAAYVTPAHQYPAGITMPVTRRFELLRWAEQHDAYVIEDDYDSDYRYNGQPIPALQGFDSAGRVLYLGTLSRSLSPSVRVGYLVLPPALAAAYGRTYARYACTVSRIEQAVLAGFFSGGHFERHISRTRKTYRQRRDAAITQLQAAIPGIRITGSDAGLHFIAEIPCTTVTSAELRNRAAKKGLVVKTVDDGQTGGDFRRAKETPQSVRLIIGYAHLSGEETGKAAQLLAECLIT